MPIRIELSPQDEAHLRERAEARGQAPEALAGEMLSSLLRSRPDRSPGYLLPVVDEEGVFHRDRWEAVLASIESRSGENPVLPPEAYTREVMYHGDPG